MAMSSNFLGLGTYSNSSTSDKKNDYVLLADALDELFTNKTMPVDVVDLYQCMRDYMYVHTLNNN